MADFVAVIRRAVDGLADNTPEMRARVYEKARSAVTRQLESMKPRPPEEMLRRQLDKLDAAITEVENEHAEALPPLEEEVAEPPYVADIEEHRDYAPEPAETPAVAEAEPAAVLVSQRVEAEAVDYETSGYETPAAPYEDEGPQEPEPAAEEERQIAPEPQYQPEPEVEAEPVEEPSAETEQQAPRTAAAEEHWNPPHEDIAARAAIAHGSRMVEAMPEWYEAAKAETLQTYGEPPTDQRIEPSAVDADRQNDTSIPAWAQPEDQWQPPAEKPPVEKDIAEAPPAAVPAAFDENTVVTEFDEFVRDDLTPMQRESWPEPKMPPAADDLSWDPSPFDEDSLEQTPLKAKATDSAFEDFASLPPVGGAKQDSGSNGGKASGNGNGNGRRAVSAKDILDMDAVEAARRPAKAIRTAPRRKVNVKALGLGLLCLLVLAGGSYAVWSNKDAINNMVSGLTSGSSTTAPEAGKPNEPASGAPSSSNAGDARGTDTASKAPTSDGSVTNKFTQRLQADGTEVNEGAGTQVGASASVEGKSVAEQNVAAKDAAGTAGTAEAGEAPAANTAGAVVADQKALPTGGQKMFLYEERLGQSVPTAIEGNVSWTLKHEQGENGRIEPSVQGQIVIPDRNLSALMTVRRNTDPSLPASHLIEIVFSLPQGFEGGSIDNVQRIAMKQTEQDRGNALIAVPAKITDDFHMIALNDFPEAMKTNLDLLRTRNWIDIPLTYRNGRRALLTMEKGTAGTDAFNTAIREWSALGNTANNQ